MSTVKKHFLNAVGRGLAPASDFAFGEITVASEGNCDNFFPKGNLL